MSLFPHQTQETIVGCSTDTCVNWRPGHQNTPSWRLWNKGGVDWKLSFDSGPNVVRTLNVCAANILILTNFTRVFAVNLDMPKNVENWKCFDYRGINNKKKPSIKNPLLIFWRILRIIKKKPQLFWSSDFQNNKPPRLIGAKRRRKFWSIFCTKNGFLKGKLKNVMFFCVQENMPK